MGHCKQELQVCSGSAQSHEKPGRGLFDRGEATSPLGQGSIGASQWVKSRPISSRSRHVRFYPQQLPWEADTKVGRNLPDGDIPCSCSESGEPLGFHDGLCLRRGEERNKSLGAITFLARGN